MERRETAGMPLYRASSTRTASRLSLFLLHTPAGFAFRSAIGKYHNQNVTNRAGLRNGAAGKHFGRRTPIERDRTRATQGPLIPEAIMNSPRKASPDTMRRESSRIHNSYPLWSERLPASDCDSVQPWLRFSHGFDGNRNPVSYITIIFEHVNCQSSEHRRTARLGQCDTMTHTNTNTKKESADDHYG